MAKRPVKRPHIKKPARPQRRAAFQNAMFQNRKNRRERYAAPGGHGN